MLGPLDLPDLGASRMTDTCLFFSMTCAVWIMRAGWGPGGICTTWRLTVAHIHSFITSYHKDESFGRELEHIHAVTVGICRATDLAKHLVTANMQQGLEDLDCDLSGSRYLPGKIPVGAGNQRLSTCISGGGVC